MWFLADVQQFAVELGERGRIVEACCLGACKSDVCNAGCSCNYVIISTMLNEPTQVTLSASGPPALSTIDSGNLQTTCYFVQSPG